MFGGFKDSSTLNYLCPFLSKLIMCTLIHSSWNLCGSPMNLIRLHSIRQNTHPQFSSRQSLLWPGLRVRVPWENTLRILRRIFVSFRSLSTLKSFWRHKKGSYGHTLEMISTISQFLSWEPLAFDKTRNVKPFYLFLNQQVLALYISSKFCLKTEQFLFLTHLSLYIIICNFFKEPTGTLSILPANLLTKIYEFIRYFFYFPCYYRWQRCQAPCLYIRRVAFSLVSQFGRTVASFPCLPSFHQQSPQGLLASSLSRCC